MAESAFDIARSYVLRGWNPVPIPFRTKGPKDAGWQDRIITEATVGRFFNGAAQNIGVVLGTSSGGLTDVDLDCPEAIAAADDLLPDTAAIFGRPSKPRSHWLYQSTLAETAGKANIKFTDPIGKDTLVELRIGGAKGAQTVFPGSVHVDGERIAWDRDGEPREIPGSHLQARVAALAAAAVFIRYWPPQGSRHEAAKALGGFLSRADWTVDDITCFVETVVDAAGDDEREDRIRAAEDAALAHKTGGRAYGIPKLDELFGKGVGVTVAGWLGYAPKKAEKAKADPSDTAFKIRTARDLGGTEFGEIRYVVPGYVVEGLTLFAGNPKIGKSWFCLDVGLAVSLGGECLGGVTCEQGDVLYLALEDNDRRLNKRIGMLLPFVDPKDWPAAFQYTTVAPRGQAALDELRKWIEGARNPRLIVVDVLQMLREGRGNQESQYEADYKVIKGLQGLALEFNIAIIVVTHTRKGPADLDPFEKVSGTLGLSGGADTTLILARGATGATLYGRGRDIEEIETAVEFEAGACRWRLLGDAAEIRRSDERGAILDALKAAGRPIGPKEIADVTGFKNGNIRRLLGKMLLAGQVSVAGYGHYTLVTPVTPVTVSENETPDPPFMH
ncbi:AAA family ATPase [Methylobacterium fujisawaense]|uniref:AAA family ATPase n=1 Tax=Methylobacterium fujisawaense TaxID=107400 RepID=UPI00313B84F3